MAYALTPQAYCDLATALEHQGATIFACGRTDYRKKPPAWDPKIPVRKDWKEGQPLADIQKVLMSSSPSHLTHIGLVPASIGAVVVDVDIGGEESVKGVKAVIGEPVFEYCTSRGKFHLVYPCGDYEWGNKRIYLQSGHIGELRSATGYVRIPRSEGCLPYGGFEKRARGVPAPDLEPLLTKDRTPEQPGLSFKEGQRNNTLNARVYSAILNGQPAIAEKARKDALKSGLPEGEVATTYASARAAAQAERERIEAEQERKRAKRKYGGEIAPTQLEALNKSLFQRYASWLWGKHVGERPEKGTPESQEAWKALRDEHTIFEIGCSLKGLETIFPCLGLEWRYNNRKDSIEWRFDNEGVFDWREITDRSENHIREFIRANFRYRYYKDSKEGPVPVVIPWPAAKTDPWNRSLNAYLATREQDPFLEWLETIPAWDRKPRLNTLLTELFGAKDTPLNHWASAYLFMGAVLRTYQPGTKLDVVPVLIGAQGVGKSTFLRQMLPEHIYCNDWFNDGLALSDRPKELVEAVAGTVLVELAEMAGVHKADLDRMKAWISRTDDGHVRSAYAHRAESRPRRFIIIATADRTDCLPTDRQGLRRFCPVTLHRRGANAKALLRNQREQLWAEAMHRVESGETIYLHGDLEAEATAKAMDHMANDAALEDIVQTSLRDADSEDHYRLTILMDAINMECDLDSAEGGLPEGAKFKHRFTSDQIITALKRFGWEGRKLRSTKYGCQLRAWMPPVGWENAPK